MQLNKSDTQADCIAIEVDGPSHFVQLSRQGAARQYMKFNAETRLKRRLLKRLGWKVVSLPYTRWDSAQSKRHLQQEILTSLLVDAGFEDTPSCSNETSE